MNEDSSESILFFSLSVMVSQSTIWFWLKQANWVEFQIRIDEFHLGLLKTTFRATTFVPVNFSVSEDMISMIGVM